MKSFVIVKLLVVNQKGEVLSLRRGEDAPRRAGEWDFPGGFLDEGEDLTTAILREAKEEAGLDIEWARVVFAMSDPDSGRHGSGTWVVFAVHVNSTPDVTLSFEHQEFAWLAPEALFDRIEYDRQRKMLRYIVDNRLLEQ